MKDIDPNAQRYRELLKLKRRILTNMRKHRKSLAKNRVEKKRVNEEITKLRKSGFAFAGMSTAAAAARVGEEIRSVRPEDIYPRDLEKQFDKLERTTEVKYKKGTVNIDDIEDDGPSRPRGGDDEAAVYIGPNAGVVDLGENDVDDTEIEPDGE